MRVTEATTDKITCAHQDSHETRPKTSEVSTISGSGGERASSLICSANEDERVAGNGVSCEIVVARRRE